MVEVLGSTNFNVRLADGRVVHRHWDQMAPYYAEAEHVREPELCEMPDYQVQLPAMTSPSEAIGSDYVPAVAPSSSPSSQACTSAGENTPATAAVPVKWRPQVHC